MEINQKKELAKLLYLTERSITQQELADRTGVSRRSIGKWIKEWENLKLNLLQTREERINSTLMQLDELDNTIQEKPRVCASQTKRSRSFVVSSQKTLLP